MGDTEASTPASLTPAEQELLDEEFGDGFTVQWCNAINRLLASRSQRPMPNPTSNGGITVSETSITINPEDGAQVRRLSDALIEALCKQGNEHEPQQYDEIRSHMRTALRSYAEIGPSLVQCRFPCDCGNDEEHCACSHTSAAAVENCGATWLFRHDQDPLVCTRSAGHEGPHQEAQPMRTQPSRPALRPVVPPPPPHIPVGGSESIDSRGLTWDRP